MLQIQNQEKESPKNGVFFKIEKKGNWNNVEQKVPFQSIKPKAEVNEAINKGRWSKKEHNLFLYGIIKYGNNWKQIKDLIQSRSNAQARSHAQKFFIKLKEQQLSVGPFVNIKKFFNKVRCLSDQEKCVLFEELKTIPFDSEDISDTSYAEQLNPFKLTSLTEKTGVGLSGQKVIGYHQPGTNFINPTNILSNNDKDNQIIYANINNLNINLNTQNALENQTTASTYTHSVEQNSSPSVNENSQSLYNFQYPTNWLGFSPRVSQSFPLFRNYNSYDVSNYLPNSLNVNWFNKLGEFSYPIEQYLSMLHQSVNLNFN